MTNIQTDQTENEPEDKLYMTPCEELGYSEGDVFEVIDADNSFYCKGMIVELDEDDGSYSPFFTYVSGPSRDETRGVDKIAIGLYRLRKFSQKADLVKSAEVIQDKLLYSTEDINAAWVNLHWSEDNKVLLIKKLNEVTDPEYKEYLRLKAKYELL